ncbi:MAG: hypothetical protein N2202_08670 [Proteobacteria bacterium]|nr:hypothetical protein [Pseudomonadota bacterium]
MKKLIALFFLGFLTGCFLVFTHESRTPSIISVHLLPPKVPESLKPSKPLDAHIGVASFDFDLKFSEEKQPFYFDYSYLPREFYQNVLVLLENGFFSKVVEQEIDTNVTPEMLIKRVSDNKLDTGLFIRVNNFKIGKKSDGWFGSIKYRILIVTQDGNTLKDEEKSFSLEKIVYPESVTIDYQSAMVASEIFNLVYEDILKSFVQLASNIEAHRSIKEVVRGKGIISIRRADLTKGKTRVLVNVRVRVIINDFDSKLFISKDELTKKVNELVSEINKNNYYRLVINIKDQSDVFYPFKLGKVVYDANNDVYNLNFTTTKEFNVTPGKTLIVANLFLPKHKETITKGLYLDVNPEKGANVGLNLLVDTKNNFFDIGFLK